MGLVGILIFRESYPYYLDPNYMSTTLVTLTKYIQPHMCVFGMCDAGWWVLYVYT